MHDAIADAQGARDINDEAIPKPIELSAEAVRGFENLAHHPGESLLTIVPESVLTIPRNTQLGA